MQRRRIAQGISAVLLMTALWPAIEFRANARAAAATSDEASGVLQAAQRQFDAGNYGGAIATLQSAVSQNPSNAQAYFWLGRSYYEIRDYDNAIAQAEKAVSLDSKNSLYHQWLGRAYGGKADRDRSFFLARKVKREFLEAVRWNPSNISARRDLEEYCIDAPWIVGGSKDEALAQVNAIAAVDPIEGHLARAIYYRDAAKKPDLAENEYRIVLSSKPNRIEAYLEVADFFERQNRPSEMEAAIAAAAQVSPNDARLAFYRGVAGVLTNANPASAERDLKSYLASTPERSDWPAHAAARVWLGRLYEGQGKRAEAAEQYRAALQIDPQRKDARARLNGLEKSAR